MSRIHVQIGYEPLNNESREKIWHGFIKKLTINHENGGQEIRCSWSTKEYIEKSKELRALEWNGREIRNGKQGSIFWLHELEAHFISAFQTAVALACYEAKDNGRIPELQGDHIREVVDMSGKFKKYLKVLQGGDAVQVAWETGIRHDAFAA